jgi:hypothetical protein
MAIKYMQLASKSATRKEINALARKLGPRSVDYFSAGEGTLVFSVKGNNTPESIKQEHNRVRRLLTQMFGQPSIGVSSSGRRAMLFDWHGVPVQLEQLSPIGALRFWVIIPCSDT